MMSIENSKDNTIHVSASVATGALNIAFFGTAGLIFLIFSMLALEWLEAKLGDGIMVIGSQALVMGYCCQSARYYKALRMPRLTTQGYIMAWCYWGAVVLFVIQVLGRHGGFMPGVLVLLMLLEALCVSINFMSVRGDVALMELVAMQGVMHYVGVFVLIGGIVRELQMYVSYSKGDFMNMDRLPTAFQNGLFWLFDHLSVGGTIFASILLLAAAYGLRLKIYSLRSGENIRDFLDKRTVVALAFFIFGSCFCVVARQVVISRQRAAIVEFETLSKAMHKNASQESETPLAENSFLLRQKDIGKLVVELSDSLAEKDAPYAWKNFNETAGNGYSSGKLARWYPENIGADEEDKASLAEYRSALDAVWQSLDAAVEALPSAHGSPISNGIYLLEEWRFLAALELGEFDKALEALDQFLVFGRHHLLVDEAVFRFNLIYASSHLLRWCEMAMMMPEEYSDEIHARAESLRVCVEGLDEKAIICAVTTMSHEKLMQVIDKQGGLADQSMVFPCVEMLARMDDIKLLKVFSRANKLEDVTVPRESMCPYTIASGCLVNDCSEKLQVLLAHLSQL